MNGWLRVVLVATWLWLTYFPAVACTAPQAPDSIPDGRTATTADMTSAVAAYKHYHANVSAYLACIEAEKTAQIRAAGDDAAATLKIRTVYSKLHLAAVDELESVADRFDMQARKFRSRK